MIIKAIRTFLWAPQRIVDFSAYWVSWPCWSYERQSVTVNGWMTDGRGKENATSQLAVKFMRSYAHHQSKPPLPSPPHTLWGHQTQRSGTAAAFQGAPLFGVSSLIFSSKSPSCAWGQQGSQYYLGQGAQALVRTHRDPNFCSSSLRCSLAL